VWEPWPISSAERRKTEEEKKKDARGVKERRNLNCGLTHSSTLLEKELPEEKKIDSGGGGGDTIAYSCELW